MKRKMTYENLLDLIEQDKRNNNDRWNFQDGLWWSGTWNGYYTLEEWKIIFFEECLMRVGDGVGSAGE